MLRIQTLLFASQTSLRPFIGIFELQELKARLVVSESERRSVLLTL